MYNDEFFKPTVLIFKIWIIDLWNLKHFLSKHGIKWKSIFKTGIYIRELDVDDTRNKVQEDIFS